MRKITFGEPVLKIEGLEARFDVIPVSNSLAILIGDRDSASIVQQLYHWTDQGYGEVIDGVRWIYKSIDEWIKEVFPTLTPWKLGKMMKKLEDRGIIRRAKLFTKHQIQKGDRFWWQPKNQTYYYSLNFEKLQELADNYKTAETPETSVSSKTKILSEREIKDTKFFDCAKNNTDITSIENNSKDQSHPHLPCVSEAKKDNNQEIDFSNPEVLQNKQINSFSSTVIQPDTNNGRVEEKINQNISTNKLDVQEPVQVEVEKPVLKPKLKTPKGTKPKRKNKAPWKSEGQFKRFYRALIEALPRAANARSPQGLAQTIIRQLRSGIPHSYWDDFVAGLPIGTSTKPEWEIEPGVPYPMFIEYLTEKLKAGNNTKSDEQTRNEVFSILEKPRQATAFWGQFKRSVVNVSEQVERDRALGVSNPHTPTWTRERIEPSIEEAAEAGQKITAVNDATQAVLESAQTRQLESIDSPSVTPSPSPPIPPSPEDPWTEDDQRTEDDQPSLSMREILAERGVKGFCKQMPQVSKAEAEAEAKAESEAIQRQQMNRKTHINQMSLDEINELLTDPIIRQELTPQIIFNDKFDIVTDNLGEVLAVKISQEYLDSGST